MHSEKRLDDSGDKSQPAGRLEGADALIAQGSRELRALKLQAEAAKAEAERAELEAILGDARAGNTAALAAWLASRTEEPADLAAHPESGHKTGSQLEQPATSTSQNTSQSTSKRHAQTGWDSPRGSRLQAAARARLIELTQSNAAQSNPAQSQAADSQSIQPQGINSRPSGEATPDLAAKAQNTSSSRETAKKVTPNPSKDAKAGAQSGAEKKALSQPEHRTAASVAVLEAVAKALENHDSDESPRGRRWVGPVVSLVAHVLLLVVLGLVVLKVPSDSAGVALQSASADRIEQVVEVVEQNDVEAPEETEVAEPANVVATAADSLTSVNISDSLATSSLDPGPLASEQLSAAAASASTMSGTGNAASFFGAAVGGNNFCYVIDASGSMRGGPWEAAKFELLKSLASLQSGQRYYVIFFNRK
ncbi:MAG TPA: hypothetical protein DDW52_09615, partial [Planctomycetaceae bacterium]|nr:hypothetical protein [Planctomycetaceae bacterium]